MKRHARQMFVLPAAGAGLITALLLALAPAALAATSLPIVHTPSTAITLYDCSKIFRRISGASGKTDTYELLMRQLDGLEPAKRADWVRQNVIPSLERALDERLAFHEVMTNGLKPGEKFFWIQQGSLKDLNENVWNMGGTEFYLRALDEELFRGLAADPKFGRIVHTNYKDRVVVSALSDADFNAKVYLPALDRVARRVASQHSSHPERTLIDWMQFIRGRTTFGSGDSLVNAHLSRLDLGRPDNWNFRISMLNVHGASLKSHLRRANLRFDQLFAKMKELKDDRAAIGAWLRSNGVDSALSDRVVDSALQYRRSLDLADFLPLSTLPTPGEVRWTRDMLERLRRGEGMKPEDKPMIESLFSENWTGQQTNFLADTLTAGAVVAVDFRGLGLKGLAARHAWFEAGADPTKITRIYEQITRDLTTRVGEIQSKIRVMAGNNSNIHFYQTGDDMLIALPKISDKGPPDITRAQYDTIMKYLAEQSDLYSAGSAIARPGESGAIATAIHEAREGLFAAKPGATPK